MASFPGAPLPESRAVSERRVPDHYAAGLAEFEREELVALLTLEQIPGLGPVRIRELLESVGTAGVQSPPADSSALADSDSRTNGRTAADTRHLARRALSSLAVHRQYPARTLAGAASRANEMFERFAALTSRDGSATGRLLGFGLVGYPAPICDLHDAPLTLSTRGDLSLLNRTCVAIVGTRRCTRYGERVTEGIASALARAGACIVSGLATGIDAAAHRAALECGGATAAVLGTGIDQVYPVAHERLQEEIAEGGVVLSEHPPGERANGGAFPRRNRIIAALAQLVIVVEAGDRSGALITASRAVDLDRRVAAVPGPIDSPQSAGSNALLRDGAHVLADVEDALSLAGLTPPPRRPPVATGKDALVIFELLQAGGGGMRLEELASRVQMPLDRCLVAVTELELSGAVTCDLTGEISRRI